MEVSRQYSSRSKTSNDEILALLKKQEENIPATDPKREEYKRIRAILSKNTPSPSLPRRFQEIVHRTKHSYVLCFDLAQTSFKNINPDRFKSGTFRRECLKKQFAGTSHDKCSDPNCRKRFIQRQVCLAQLKPAPLSYKKKLLAYHKSDPRLRSNRPEITHRTKDQKVKDVLEEVKLMKAETLRKFEESQGSEKVLYRNTYANKSPKSKLSPRIVRTCSELSTDDCLNQISNELENISSEMSLLASSSSTPTKDSVEMRLAELWNESLDSTIEIDQEDTLIIDESDAVVIDGMLQQEAIEQVENYVASKEFYPDDPREFGEIPNHPKQLKVESVQKNFHEINAIKSTQDKQNPNHRGQLKVESVQQNFYEINAMESTQETYVDRQSSKTIQQSSSQVETTKETFADRQSPKTIEQSSAQLESTQTNVESIPRNKWKDCKTFSEHDLWKFGENLNHREQLKVKLVQQNFHENNAMESTLETYVDRQSPKRIQQSSPQVETTVETKQHDLRIFGANHCPQVKVESIQRNFDEINGIEPTEETYVESLKTSQQSFPQVQTNDEAKQRDPRIFRANHCQQLKVEIQQNRINESAQETNVDRQFPKTKQNSLQLSTSVEFFQQGSREANYIQQLNVDSIQYNQIVDRQIPKIIQQSPRMETSDELIQFDPRLRNSKPNHNAYVTPHLKTSVELIQHDTQQLDANQQTTLATKDIEVEFCSDVLKQLKATDSQQIHKTFAEEATKPTVELFQPREMIQRTELNDSQVNPIESIPQSRTYALNPNELTKTVDQFRFPKRPSNLPIYGTIVKPFLNDSHQQNTVEFIQPKDSIVIDLTESDEVKIKSEIPDISTDYLNIINDLVKEFTMTLIYQRAYNERIKFAKRVIFEDFQRVEYIRGMAQALQTKLFSTIPCFFVEGIFDYFTQIINESYSKDPFSSKQVEYIYQQMIESVPTLRQEYLRVEQQNTVKVEVKEEVIEISDDSIIDLTTEVKEEPGLDQPVTIFKELEQKMLEVYKNRTGNDASTNPNWLQEMNIDQERLESLIFRVADSNRPDQHKEPPSIQPGQYVGLRSEPSYGGSVIRNYQTHGYLTQFQPPQIPTMQGFPQLGEDLERRRLHQWLLECQEMERLKQMARNNHRI